MTATLVGHWTQLDVSNLTSVTTTSLAGYHSRQHRHAHHSQRPSERAHSTDQCLSPADHRVSGQYDGRLHLSYTLGGLGMESYIAALYAIIRGSMDWVINRTMRHNELTTA